MIEEDRGAAAEPRTWPPLQKGQSYPGAGGLGMAIFLVSLGVLFASSLVAYLVVRSRIDPWPPPEAPGCRA
ncbi:MAG: hypothetical protein ACE5GW_01470 [Planctomycetota bacterium]